MGKSQPFFSSADPETSILNHCHLSIRKEYELRYALYQSAVVATTKNRAFIDYFTKLQKGRGKERGIKTKMRVNVDAKMLIISWTLLKKGGVFQGEHLTS
jgi:hypothetical protein